MLSRKTIKIDKKEFYNAIVESKELGELTPKAFELIMQLCKNYMTRTYYKNSQDRDECFQSAITDCLTGWSKFNPDYSSNAFSYFTQIIKNGLIKGWNDIYKQKIDVISLESGEESDDGGIYSI